MARFEPIPGGLAVARPPERAQAKIEKYQDNSGGNHKHSVIRTMSPAGPHAPEVWGKRNHRKKEKDACDLQPDNAPDAAKRPQKSTNATGNVCAGLSSHADDLPRGLNMNPSIDNSLRGRRGGALRTFC